jgi:transposase
MLSAAGIEVYVVNGRHVKHIPGRKTDVKDCMWIKEYIATKCFATVL